MRAPKHCMQTDPPKNYAALLIALRARVELALIEIATLLQDTVK